MYKRNSYRPRQRSFSNRGRGRFSQKKRPEIWQYVSKVTASASRNLSLQKPEPTISQVGFSDFNLDSRLLNNVLKRGFTKPTPIQEKTIPHIMMGKDVIGIANTGTGKTGAFLIPLINKLIKNPREGVLIITPTRELAQQIRDELRYLAEGLSLFSTLCIGGSFIRNQIFQLRRNPHFVIGTPGRLKDLIKHKELKMKTYTNIVLDEVDRMVDMGFIADIKYLISLLPEKRQSLFFSATVSPQINSIIQTFVRNAVTVSVSFQDIPANVEHKIIQVEKGKTKISVLMDLLRQAEFKKVLVFGRTKHGVERLSKDLFEYGFKAISIHGNKRQNKREQAIRLFKQEEVNILVATDVAARGLDIPNITHVINYDEPATYEDYIHRAGRTGRVDKKGYALTLVG